MTSAPSAWRRRPRGSPDPHRRKAKFSRQRNSGVIDFIRPFLRWRVMAAAAWFRSTEDLARFYRALLRGEVFQRPATLQTMLTVPSSDANPPRRRVCDGIQRRTIGGEACWGHTGFWGTAVYHCAGPDVTIVRHINQAQPDGSFIIRTLFDRIAQVLQMGG